VALAMVRGVNPREWWTLLRGAAKGWVDDAAPSMGAALAFYTLFSLAPLLIITVAVAGFFIGEGEAEGLLMQQMTQLMGDGATGAIAKVMHAANERGSGVIAAIFGLAALLLGATTVFTELQRDLDIIWRSPRTKAKNVWTLVLSRLLSFGIVLAIGFLLLVSLVVSTAISAVSDVLFEGSRVLAQSGEFATSFLVITLLFAAIYKLLPSRHIRWGDVWVGAAVTSLLFNIGKILIGLYLSRATVGSPYGAAGTLVVLILWIYYSAQIFFFGAEFTREYALSHGSHRDEGTVEALGAAGDDGNILARARAIVRGSDTIFGGAK